MENEAITTTSSLVEEEGTPLRGIFCLKTKQDMKKIEETEDCFILDFNPFDSFDVKKLSLSDDTDLSILHSTGQVACRDYPHPRHLCLKYPFGSTPNTTYCDMCYCNVCDKPAITCGQWISSHCNTTKKVTDPERDKYNPALLNFFLAPLKFPSGSVTDYNDFYTPLSPARID